MHNILHIDTEKTWRGGERQLAFLLKYSDKSKFKHIVALRKGTELEKKAVEYGAELLYVSPFSEFDPLAIVKIRNCIREKKVDLVHAHTARAVGLGACACIGNDIPFVAHRRVDFHTHRNFFTVFKYNKADVIITVSNAIKDVLVEDGYEQSRITAIHSGVDFSQYDKINKIDIKTKYGLAQDTTIIGMINALAPHKDIFNFLSAFKIVSDSGYKVAGLIAGEGELKNELINKCKELNINDKIIFTGFVNNPLDWLASFDIFVISSYLEGLGSTVLDAMAFGVPVAATTAGGIPEMIEHGQTGLLSEVRNPIMLAENIKRILHDGRLRQMIVNGAKEKAKLFDVRNTVFQIEHVYERLVIR